MIHDNNENYGQNGRNFQSENEEITSETIEKKDPAINQHHDDSLNRNQNSGNQYDIDRSQNEDADDNEETDPYFQKNAEIAQDLDNELKNDNDPDDEEDLDEDLEDNDEDFDRSDRSDLRERNFDDENEDDSSRENLEPENPNINDPDPFAPQRF
ncbi:hypothetical protein B0A79_18675 [Flavobacterium piscis]|uniref:Highly acidic protein n=1 Tax=Flavobacterium piscis TaxID=1114874 RepID=A0ABX2XI23_9FLAO|nr:hypothetical protein [Flavobacterium piscis]OCB73602.1 hypothetical protein FLP_13040 [Flavobacterium piscis]OXF00064.1 hypothetical protein B0A79_18675 [Flavobacterium piscis]